MVADPANVSSFPNPFLALPYEPAFESLGEDFYDVVAAADFPRHTLRFRNDALLPKLGLDPQQVTDADFVHAFGKFGDRHPLLAMRYHGYQFGAYNSFLGDGRGFLYGQVRGNDGELYDFGTKGSGTTPYSRGGDGRLTLKGGVREVLAAEALHVVGVRTSRCLSLVETGEDLWRGDEPSPTRSSVMVRMNRSHIRFGTFERLHHIGRPDLIPQLLDHVIEYYYPHLQHESDRYSRFYAELVQRTASLVAQWMSVGFCHAVLNTDNMSITGESFDYGPYAFIDRYDPRFTAAYFDYSSRYCYGNQPRICELNLEMLQAPLIEVVSAKDLETGLSQFSSHYREAYCQRLLNKLGFISLSQDLMDDLLSATWRLLQESDIGYHKFFLALRQQFSPMWRQDAQLVFNESVTDLIPEQEDADSQPMPMSDRIDDNLLQHWQQNYHRALNEVPSDELDAIAQRLRQYNPDTVLLRPEIEAIWEPITVDDNWQPFYDLLDRIRNSVESPT